MLNQQKLEVMKLRRHDRNLRKKGYRGTRNTLRGNIQEALAAVVAHAKNIEDLQGKRAAAEDPEAQKEIDAAISVAKAEADALPAKIEAWKKELNDIDPEVLRRKHVEGVKAEQRRRKLAKHPPHGPGKK